MMAGSGLKGAARHHFMRSWSDTSLINRLFGPDKDAADHAGAIAFGDAQLVAFPVRSLRNTFVYATCPTALARLKRMAGDAAPWAVPSVKDDEARVAGDGALSAGRLVLEAFDFKAEVDAGLVGVAAWLSKSALPAGAAHDYFRNKIAADLVLLTDTAFSHFVRHATVVEAHVRINNATGTADSGGLFYTENLPPESLLAGLVLASIERPSKKAKAADGAPLMDATQVLAAVLNAENGLCSGLLQVGGDATTGRGLVAIAALGGM
jgi:CRISPR-associated protein Cmr4